LAGNQKLLPYWPIRAVAKKLTEGKFAHLFPVKLRLK